MRIRIAHSPDCDDAVMFYGLAGGEVPSNGDELEHVPPIPRRSTPP
jgi:predicted solute-binding protein